MKLWSLMGRVAFWLGWPALWLQLRGSQRTRVVITADKQVVLVKGWLGTGQWSLPGGGVHKGEAPLTGAIREVQEETGLQIEARQTKLISSGVSHRRGLRFGYKAYRSTLPTTQPLQRQPLELTDIGWFQLDKLNAVNLSADSRAILNNYLR